MGICKFSRKELMVNRQDRISEFLDVIIKVAQGDYSVQVSLTGENDDFDAIAMGINMMVDDIKKKHETEEENERILFLNEQLRVAMEKAKESDRLKSAFLANMSHEIRTPMNSILGFAGLLKRPLVSEENRNKYIDLIEQGGKRMLNLINELIDISKIESGQMDVYISDTNFVGLVDEIYLFFEPEATTKEISLIWEKSEEINKHPIIKTDCEKINAVLTNLVKNAIKFTDEGSITIGCEIKNDFLLFSVKDTGIGIPSDKLEAVFDRFSQVKDPITSGYEGSGLGLSISKGYIDILGGKIWAESKKDKGSEFYFTIPYDVVISSSEIETNGGCGCERLLYN